MVGASGTSMSMTVGALGTVPAKGSGAGKLKLIGGAAESNVGESGMTTRSSVGAEGSEPENGCGACTAIDAGEYA